MFQFLCIDCGRAGSRPDDCVAEDEQVDEDQLNTYVDIFVEYFFWCPINAEDYQWPPRRPVFMDVTLKQRKQVSEAYNSACIDKKICLAKKFIECWGGIWGNQKETIEKYVRASCQNALNRKEGIATWSKILSLVDPEVFLIYDSRVAMALNAIIFASNQTGTRDRMPYFPFVPRREGPCLHAVERLRSHCTNNPRVGYVSGREFYLNYCIILHAVAKQLGANPCHLEMMLFARSPCLARLFWATTSDTTEVPN